VQAFRGPIDKRVAKRVVKMTEDYARAITGRDVEVQVEFTRRLKRYVGMCYKNDCILQYDATYCELNRDNDEALKCVVVHECAHLVDDSHGPEFMSICKEYDVDPFGYPDGTVLRHHNYIAECSCGFRRYYYHNRKKYWSTRECPNCSGKVRVRINKWWEGVVYDD
jgi:predicted SprT family Zn-dependent metalloprotease